MFPLILRQLIFIIMAFNVSTNISSVSSAASMFLLLLAVSRIKTAAPPSCNPLLAIDCNFYHEDFVWSLNPDNELCIPLVNRCVFNNINCQRYLQDKPLLKEIPQPDCQKHCSAVCSAGIEERKVCAQRDSKNCYFKNKCELDRYICEHAEMWWYTSSTDCEAVVNETCP